MAGTLISNSSGTILKDGTGKKCVRVCITDDQVPLSVTFSPFSNASFDSLNQYGEVTSIAISTETDVLSYTVPASKKVAIANIDASGDNIAAFRVKLNGSTIAKKRTAISGSPNVEFTFENYELAAGDVIKVTVENCSLTLDTGDFEARINGFIGDA